jgi:hypothetical protein
LITTPPGMRVLCLSGVSGPAWTGSGTRSFPSVQRSPKAETRRYEQAFSSVASTSIPVRNTSLASRHSGSSRTRLGATMTTEHLAEELGALSPHDRVTCRFHQRSLHECVASPLHAIPVTGHRWCPTCQCTVNVAVDVLAGSVWLACRSCGRFPDTLANRQIIRSCRGSMNAVRQGLDQPRCVEIVSDVRGPA